MADLHFVDFALITSPVRKETQFKLPDDFSEFDFTDSITDEPVRVRFSRAFSSFTSRADSCSAIRTWGLEMFYTKRAKQDISTFPLSEVEIVAY